MSIALLHCSERPENHRRRQASYIRGITAVDKLDFKLLTRLGDGYIGMAGLSMELRGDEAGLDAANTATLSS